VAVSVNVGAARPAALPIKANFLPSVDLSTLYPVAEATFDQVTCTEVGPVAEANTLEAATTAGGLGVETVTRDEVFAAWEVTVCAAVACGFAAERNRRGSKFSIAAAALAWRAR